MNRMLPLASVVVIVCLSNPPASRSQDLSQDPLPGDSTIPGQGSQELPGGSILPNVDVNLSHLLENSKLVDALDEKAKEQATKKDQDAKNAESVLADAEKEAKNLEDESTTDVTAMGELNKFIAMMGSNTAGNTIQIPQPPTGIIAQSPHSKASPSMVNRKKTQPKISNGVYTFRANNRFVEMEKMGDMVPLPQGSIAVVKTIDGIAAEIGSMGDISLAVDTTFLGPNGTVVDLKGCRIELAVTGRANKSTVVAARQRDNASISCRSNDGSVFNTAMTTKIIDPINEYQGGSGRIVHNGQWKKMALDFLNGGIQAYGAAMAAAQVTTTIGGGNSSNEPVKGTAITGSRDQYIAGQTIKGATGKFLNNITDFYGTMKPTIDMEPGKTLYLYIKRNTYIPKKFFEFHRDQRLVNTLVNKHSKVLGKWFVSQK